MPHDVARAREELRTLLRAGRPDGFVPHTVFWHNLAALAARAALRDAARARQPPHATIQTPLLAFAWERVAAASSDDPGFATECLQALAAHLDWLERERDPDGDGLITIILPDESGLDDCPSTTPSTARTRTTSPATSGWWRAAAAWAGARARSRRHDEHVEDVLVNVAYALSLRALARITGDGAYARRADVSRRR